MEREHKAEEQKKNIEKSWRCNNVEEESEKDT